MDDHADEAQPDTNAVIIAATVKEKRKLLVNQFNNLIVYKGGHQRCLLLAYIFRLILGLSTADLGLMMLHNPQAHAKHHHTQVRSLASMLGALVFWVQEQAGLPSESNIQQLLSELSDQLVGLLTSEPKMLREQAQTVALIYLERFDLEKAREAASFAVSCDPNDLEMMSLFQTLSTVLDGVTDKTVGSVVATTTSPFATVGSLRMIHKLVGRETPLSLVHAKQLRLEVCRLLAQEGTEIPGRETRGEDLLDSLFHAIMLEMREVPVAEVRSLCDRASDRLGRAYDKTALLLPTGTLYHGQVAPRYVILVDMKTQHHVLSLLLDNPFTKGMVDPVTGRYQCDLKDATHHVQGQLEAEGSLR